MLGHLLFWKLVGPAGPKFDGASRFLAGHNRVEKRAFKRAMKARSRGATALARS